MTPGMSRQVLPGMTPPQADDKQQCCSSSTCGWGPCWAREVSLAGWLHETFSRTCHPATADDNKVLKLLSAGVSNNAAVGVGVECHSWATNTGLVGYMRTTGHMFYHLPLGF